MPKLMSSKMILTACHKSFQGTSNRDIAKEFGVTEATVSNWRKMDIWIEFEAELIDACKQQILSLEGLSDVATSP